MHWMWLFMVECECEKSLLANSIMSSSSHVWLNEFLLLLSSGCNVTNATCGNIKYVLSSMVVVMKETASTFAQSAACWKWRGVNESPCPLLQSWVLWICQRLSSVTIWSSAWHPSLSRNAWSVPKPRAKTSMRYCQLLVYVFVATSCRSCLLPLWAHSLLRILYFNDFTVRQTLKKAPLLYVSYRFQEQRLWLWEWYLLWIKNWRWSSAFWSFSQKRIIQLTTHISPRCDHD